MALSASQIVSNACQVAKCPGMTLQAGQFLNDILEHVAQTYDLPETQQVTALNVAPNGGMASNPSNPAQPFQWYETPLPAGARYLRTKEVFYNVLGVIFYLDQVNKPKYDRLFQGQGISNYPYWYCPDQAPAIPQMAFYPPPNINLTIFVRTQFLPQDIASPEISATVPWFRNRRYLVTQLACDLMQLTDDTRWSTFQAASDEMMRDYLKTINDEGDVATRVRLDPLMFRAPNALPPTKTTGF